MHFASSHQRLSLLGRQCLLHIPFIIVIFFGYVTEAVSKIKARELGIPAQNDLQRDGHSTDESSQARGKAPYILLCD
jgi:hypothetical protein